MKYYQMLQILKKLKVIVCEKKKWKLTLNSKHAMIYHTLRHCYSGNLTSYEIETSNPKVPVCAVADFLSPRQAVIGVDRYDMISFRTLSTKKFSGKLVM